MFKIRAGTIRAGFSREGKILATLSGRLSSVISSTFLKIRSVMFAFGPSSRAQQSGWEGLFHPNANSRTKFHAKKGG